jgi:hypothetical protein
VQGEFGWPVGFWAGVVGDQLVFEGFGEQVRADGAEGGAWDGVRVAELVDEVQHMRVGSGAVGVQELVEPAVPGGVEHSGCELEGEGVAGSSAGAGSGGEQGGGAADAVIDLLRSERAPELVAPSRPSTPEATARGQVAEL